MAHGRARASTDEVLAIRARVAAGETQVAVAASLGYSKQYINDIIRGKTRKYE